MIISDEEAEKPVVYWEHETGDIKYLADSFRDYLERIARLYFVGDEIWQMELFLESDGINPDNEYAVRWRAWFDALSGPEPQAVNEDLKSLFALALTRRKMSDKIKKALLVYKKEDIFSMIQKNLLNMKNRDTKELLVRMTAELIGGTAKDWVESLWEKTEKHCEDSPSVFIFEQYEIPSDLAAYLSAGCMEEEKAFQLVTRFLTQRAGNKIDGFSACAHLKYFNKSLVIPWMERQNINSPCGWDLLFMSVIPEWRDLQRWSEDSKRKKVLIDGLALLAEGEELTAPSGLPDREIVAAWLGQLEETELFDLLYEA